MKNSRKLTRLFAIAAVFFVIFQSFAMSALAVAPWTGSSWEGKTWTGNTWKGNSWSGDSWQGQKWQSTSDGGGSKAGSGSSLEGNTSSIPPWNIQLGITYPGGWNGNPFNGTGTTGNVLNGPPLAGLNKYNTIANLPPPEPSNKENSEEKKNKDFMNKAEKYAFDTVINGHAKMLLDIKNNENKFFNDLRTKPNYFSKVFISGFKLGFEGSIPADALIYTHDGIDKFNKAKENLKKYKDARKAQKDPTKVKSLAGKGKQIVTGLKETVRPLPILNMVSSGVSAYYAGKDVFTYVGKIKASTGDKKIENIGGAMASTGEFLVNAGSLIGQVPIPGFQAFGAGMAVGGAVLWGIGTAVKLIARHRKKISAAFGAIRSGVQAFFAR